MGIDLSCKATFGWPSLLAWESTYPCGPHGGVLPAGKSVPGSAGWSDAECHAWMFRNQNARRNLSPEQEREMMREAVKSWKADNPDEPLPDWLAW